MAWAASNKLTTVWKSNLSRNLKIRVFRVSLQIVLLYGSKSWTLTVTLEKKVDGRYTRRLQTALGKSWKDHITKKEICGNLPPISKTLQTRTPRFKGQVRIRMRILLLQNPTNRRSRGRPAITLNHRLI